MAKFQFQKQRAWMLTIDQKYVDITAGVPTYNEEWRFTDVNGHEHSGAAVMATLEEVVDESHWCDGNEGIAPHDPHLAVDKSHLVCKICGVTVNPKVDPPFTPKSMPGSWTATLSGIRSDGMRVEVDVTPQQIKHLQASTEAEQDVLAQRILDRSERIRSISSR